MTDRPKFWSGPGGALLCDRSIEGLTQELTGDSVEYYTGKYFVGETIMYGAASRIVEALGGEYFRSKDVKDLKATYDSLMRNSQPSERGLR